VNIIAAFDFETTGLNLYKDDAPFALSITLYSGESYTSIEDLTEKLQRRTEYFECRVDPKTRKVAPWKPGDIARIRMILENPTIIKVGHNIKFDVLCAELGLDIKVCGQIHDTIFMAHCVKSDEPTFKLKPLCKKFHLVGTEDRDELVDATKVARRYGKMQGWKLATGGDDREEDSALHADYWMVREHAIATNDQNKLGLLCGAYCRKDTIRTMLLALMYWKVHERDDCARITYEHERLCWPVVYRMERRGVRVDLDIVREERRYAVMRKAKLKSELVQVFGEFDTEVPEDQLRAYLFGPKTDGGLGLVPDPDKLTEVKRLPQVTKDVLEDLANVVPILETKIEYDRCHKAKTTYHDNYLDYAVPEHGYYVIHANFNQVGPKTGRLSCRNPNLQNVPLRGKPGDVMLRVRRPFGPRPGYVWLHLDWKNIEARIFAEEANETDMLKIFADKGDVYQELVDRVIDITKIDLYKLLSFADTKPRTGARQICKNNFLGWTYGEGKKKLQRALRLPSPEMAAKVIDALRAAYPRAKPYMDMEQRAAKRNHCVINRYQQRVPVPPPKRDKGVVEEYWYMAVNRRIQSTAARMMKWAMIHCDAFLGGDGNDDAYVLMTVHDELIFEVRKECLTRSLVNDLASIMKTTGEEHYRKVEFPVDAKVTKQSWHAPEALKMELDFSNKPGLIGV
jgi:DNA polymerase I-like protein with 3'-5' exonuclease and polymerase domains